jgi:hypothetical protein
MHALEEIAERIRHLKPYCRPRQNFPGITLTAIALTPFAVHRDKMIWRQRIWPRRKSGNGFHHAKRAIQI